MATYPSVLAREVPRTEEPGGLQVAKSWTHFTTEQQQNRADFIDPFVCRWAFGLLPLFGYRGHCCREHWCTHTSLNTFQCLSVCIQEWKCSLTLILCAFLRSCHPVSTALHHVACSPPACKGPVSSHPHQLGLLFLFSVIVAR